MSKECDQVRHLPFVWGDCFGDLASLVSCEAVFHRETIHHKLHHAATEYQSFANKSFAKPGFSEAIADYQKPSVKQ